MSDLISRSALIEDIKKQYDMMKLYFPQSFISFLQAQPLVEPVRGEWVPEEKIYRSPLALNYRCSQCGETSRKTNFCPNCGCDMRGKKND